MQKRTLGKNGLEVSAIGLGCMTIGKDYSNESKAQAIKIIRRAYELGVTMFDTAELYGGGGKNESSCRSFRSFVGTSKAIDGDLVLVALIFGYGEADIDAGFGLTCFKLAVIKVVHEGFQYTS